MTCQLCGADMKDTLRSHLLHAHTQLRYEHPEHKWQYQCNCGFIGDYLQVRCHFALMPEAEADQHVLTAKLLGETNVCHILAPIFSHPKK